MSDHQSFALLLLRQIVGAHRALLEAEALSAGGRDDSVEAARQRLGRLVHQASVQFGAPRDAGDEAEARAAAGR